jgi:hypothetical protein
MKLIVIARIVLDMIVYEVIIGYWVCSLGLNQMQLVCKIAVTGRPVIPKDIFRCVCNLIRRGLLLNPSDRPAFKGIYNIFGFRAHGNCLSRKLEGPFAPCNKSYHHPAPN